MDGSGSLEVIFHVKTFRPDVVYSLYEMGPLPLVRVGGRYVYIMGGRRYVALSKGLHSDRNKATIRSDALKTSCDQLPDNRFVCADLLFSRSTDESCMASIVDNTALPESCQTASVAQNVPLYSWATEGELFIFRPNTCLLYTSPSPRDRQKSRMPSSA